MFINERMVLLVLQRVVFFARNTTDLSIVVLVEIFVTPVVLPDRLHIRHTLSTTIDLTVFYSWVNKLARLMWLWHHSTWTKIHSWMNESRFGTTVSPVENFISGLTIITESASISRTLQLRNCAMKNGIVGIYFLHWHRMGQSTKMYLPNFFIFINKT